MPRYRWIFGGSVRKNLVLNDCQATILLPVPTLTLCYLEKWQSWQPAQSHQLPLRATSFPSCFSPQDGAACRPCSQPVGRPGTPPPPPPPAPPPHPGKGERQKHSEIPRTTGHAEWLTSVKSQCLLLLSIDPATGSQQQSNTVDLNPSKCSQCSAHEQMICRITAYVYDKSSSLCCISHRFNKDNMW